MKTRILCVIIFFLQKIMQFMEIYGRIRRVTYDSIIWRMRFACWITNATDTGNMQYLSLFHGNITYPNAPHCHVFTYVTCLAKNTYVYGICHVLCSVTERILYGFSVLILWYWQRRLSRLCTYGTYILSIIMCIRVYKLMYVCCTRIGSCYTHCAHGLATVQMNRITYCLRRLAREVWLLASHNRRWWWRG